MPFVHIIRILFDLKGSRLSLQVPGVDVPLAYGLESLVLGGSTTSLITAAGQIAAGTSKKLSSAGSRAECESLSLSIYLSLARSLSLSLAQLMAAKSIELSIFADTARGMLS